MSNFNHLLARDLNKKYVKIVKAKGIFLITEDERKIIDASGEAAVSCLGHKNTKIKF
jgi:adenosylmethionine-8-amino-7-oxononanoate aminotransferase